MIWAAYDSVVNMFGFHVIGIARMKQRGDGACDVLNLMGQGAAIFTNSFFIQLSMSIKQNLRGRCSTAGCRKFSLQNRLSTMHVRHRPYSASYSTVNIRTLNLGETLTSFKDFAGSFDPALRGLSLSNSEVIRQVHNSFSRQQMFEFDEKASKKDDVFHFVGYLPIDNRLYELDGLKDGPVDLGSIPADSDWLDAVRPVIEKRMQKYSADEIHFNLMAVVSDRKDLYEKRLDELKKQMTGGMETDDLQAEMNQLHFFIQEEEHKMKNYKIENVRRRHNYLPFIMELLKILAEQEKLLPLVEKAKEKATKRKEEKERAKQDPIGDKVI
ncbi:hypothetical protein ScPMuIL_011206 [Solemya velum]